MRTLLALLIVVLMATPVTTAIAYDTTYEAELGRSILVEERTAIWCPSCAEIDPELSIVADSHGARIAIIGLHVEDEFENEASLARIAYQMQSDSAPYGTPTFFVDHMKTAEGYEAWNDVQKRILTQENSRSAPESMSFSVDSTGAHYPIPDYGQLTIMLLEHNEEVLASGEDNPGESIRDRVLIAMTVVSSNGTEVVYGNMTELPESWSFVFIHEPVDGGEPYGVREITNREIPSPETNLLGWIMAAGILLGGAMVFIPKKYHLIPEEE